MFTKLRQLLQWFIDLRDSSILPTLHGKPFKYSLFAGTAVGSPIATYYGTSHIINKKNLELLLEGTKKYNHLLSQKENFEAINELLKKEKIDLIKFQDELQIEKNQVIQDKEEIIQKNQKQKEEFQEFKRVWEEQKSSFKTQINSITQEKTLLQNKNESLQSEKNRVIQENKRQREEFQESQKDWKEQESSFKTRISAITQEKTILQSKIYQEMVEAKDILTNEGYEFFRRSKFVSTWSGLSKVKPTSSPTADVALKEEKYYFRENYEYFKNYHNHKYSSDNNSNFLLKYLVPNDWSFPKNGKAAHYYAFNVRSGLNIKKIIESLKKPYRTTDNPNYDQNSFINQYLTPFTGNKLQIKNWNHKVNVEFLANSYYYNKFGEQRNASSYGLSGDHSIKPIKNLELNKVFKHQSDLEIVLKILYFLDLTAQYKLLKTKPLVISFSFEDLNQSSSRFLTGILNKNLTLRTNNFPSAESFINYLILKVLEYKNSHGKINLSDTVHPAILI